MTWVLPSVLLVIIRNTLLYLMKLYTVINKVMSKAGCLLVGGGYNNREERAKPRSNSISSSKPHTSSQ